MENLTAEMESYSLIQHPLPNTAPYLLGILEMGGLFSKATARLQNLWNSGLSLFFFKGS